MTHFKLRRNQLCSLFRFILNSFQKYLQCLEVGVKLLLLLLGDQPFCQLEEATEFGRGTEDQLRAVFLGAHSSVAA